MEKSSFDFRTRRGFLAGAAAFGVSALAGVSGHAWAELPPEKRSVRLVRNTAICLAPQYLAEELLLLEGFSEVVYVDQGTDSDPHVVVASGRADITMDGATALVPALDRSQPLTIVAGIHGGCYELFTSDRVRSILDLRGRSVGVWAIGAADHIYIASMMAYVGLDPRTFVSWVPTGTFDGPMKLLEEGKVDAFLGFPPLPQIARAKRIGRLLVDTAHDRPWSQHFCCMLAGHREFVRRNPVATKRVLRAFLKSADVCARQPEQVARYLVTKGYETDYNIALTVVKDVQYNAWRAFDPGDTLRFHALRLHDVGMIATTPNDLVNEGTNWRFLEALKKELKA